MRTSITYVTNFVSATRRLLGRTSEGAGFVEEVDMEFTTDSILTDEDGDVLVDESGDVLTG